MTWNLPISKVLVPTKFQTFVTLPHETHLPLAPHPGAFGVKRKHHTHEGVDLYCAEGTDVHAVEDGKIVAILHFTGEQAIPPSLWWRDTMAMLVEGESGVVVYGEMAPRLGKLVGDKVRRGDVVGNVMQVLSHYKGFPVSMLHLELHIHGTRDAYDWVDEKPVSLLDPTPFLMEAR